MIIDPGIRKPTLSEIQRLNGSWRKDRRYLGCCGHWMMNEGGGAQLYDATRTGSHGPFVNSPLWDSGSFGYALTFNGTRHIRGNIVESFTTKITIAARIKTSSATVQYIFSHGRDSGSFSPCLILEVSAAGFLHFWDYVGGSNFTGVVSSVGVADGAWHHVVWTRDETAGAYYVDGAAAGTATGTKNDSYAAATRTFTLGRNVRDNTNNFVGQIDDVRIYNRPLTAPEIKSLYYDPFQEFRRVKKYYFIQQAPGAPALTIEAVN